MKKYENYDATQAITGDFETIELGGHICKIKAVECQEKSYGELLTISFDIDEGKNAGFYQRRYQDDKAKNGNNAKWRGRLFQTVKQDDLRFFKGFITAIEKSNDGFKWSWDEKQLVGKKFLGVFGEEEYEATDGDIKTVTKCVAVRSIDQFGKIKIPELKKLKQKDAGFTPVVDDSTEDFPF